MKKSPECVELQSRMLEYFSNPDASLLNEIELHSARCEACRNEFKELELVLEEIHKSSKKEADVVPEHPLGAIESRLDSEKQLQMAGEKSLRVRSALILQYSYLVVMSVVIWLTLLFGQAFLNEWLNVRSLLTAVSLIDEYGLFMLFFIVGGLFALLSSPILIRTAMRKGIHDKTEKFSIRSISNGIRFFAC